MATFQEIRHSLDLLEQFKETLCSISQNTSLKARVIVEKEQIDDVITVLNKLSDEYSAAQTKVNKELESTARLISLIHDLKEAADQEQLQKILGPSQQSLLLTIDRVENLLRQWGERSKKVQKVDNDPIQK